MPGHAAYKNCLKGPIVTHAVPGTRKHAAAAERRKWPQHMTYVDHLTHP